MFDWDEDYDDLIMSGAAGPGSCMPEGVRAREEKPRRAPPHLPRLMVLALALSGVIAASLAISGKVSIFADPASLGWSKALPFASPLPPVELQVLEASESVRFQAGLRAFEKADLLRYALSTRRDLAQGHPFMQPYLADALRLIEHEVARRGI